MKTYISLFLLLFYSNYSILKAQSIGFQIPEELDHVDIPFEFINNFIVLDVQFNYIFSLKFILDTGAEHSILTKREITDIMRTPYLRTFKIIGSDLQTILLAHLVRDMHIQVGEISAPHQDILILDQDYFQFEQFTGIAIHGIIGSDMFKRHTLKIDYGKKVISFYRAASFKKPKNKAFQEIDIEISKNKPYLKTNIHLQNDTTINVKLLLDTGASLPLLLNTFTHPQLKMPENVIKGNIGTGLGGFLEGYKGRIKALDIADFEIPNIITSFQDLAPDQDTTYMNGRNGIIGNEILSRFRVIIDYQRQKLYLKANKNFDKQFKVDRSGITLIATGSQLKKYIVYNILEDSPAYEAGIRKGDLVKSVNYIPAFFFSLENVVDILQSKEGRKIRLKIKRKGTAQTAVFYLRDLI